MFTCNGWAVRSPWEVIIEGDFQAFQMARIEVVAFIAQPQNNYNTQPDVSAPLVTMDSVYC